MPKLDTWVQVSTIISKALRGRTMLARFLPGMAMIVICSLVLGIMAAALLLTLLYGIYQLLLQQGWASYDALLGICGAMLGIIAVLGIAMRCAFRKLERPSLPSQVTDIADAFIRGLKTPSSLD